MAKFIKKLIIACSAVALVLFQATALWGGTTGKISGRIVDATTGNPLIGANIVVSGTTLGAAADAEGDYFIINVPPGNYDVVATMIGYAEMTVTGVNVDIDHTTPLDFQLSTTVLQAEAVTVTAEREIVKMDESSSVISATVSEITEVPLVDDISEFMLMQAGVMQSGGETLIRGGGLDQQQLMVDGLLVVDNRTNTPLLSVNLSSIAEMSIVMGGFNAEYGNVRAGMINVVTKEGGQNYSGSLDLRYNPPRIKHQGPTIFDPDHYSLKAYLNPDVMWDGVQSVSDTDMVDYISALGDLSNVLVGHYVDEKIVGGAADGTDSLVLGEAIYADLSDFEVTDDIDLNWDDRRSYGAYTWSGWLAQSSDSVELALANVAAFLYEHSIDRLGIDDEERTYGDRPDFLYDLSLGGPVPVIGSMLGDMTFFLSHRHDTQQWTVDRFERDNYQEVNTQLRLSSRITPTMKFFMDASIGRVYTVASQTNSGSNSGSYYGSGNGGGAIPGRDGYYSHSHTNFDIHRDMFGIGLDHTLSDRTFYEFRMSYVNTRNFNGRWPQSEWSYFDLDPDSAPIAVIGDVWAYGQPTGGIVHNPTTTKGDGRDWGGQGGGAQDSSSVATLNIQLDVTSQVNKLHQVKAGITFTRDDIHTLYRSERYDAPETWTYTEWSQTPFRYGAYIQDKLEFEGMVANIGLRMEANNPNVDWYDTRPTDDPFETEFGPYAKWFTFKLRDQFKTDMPRHKAKGNMVLQPRIGVTHPISENAKMYFNYGHTYSMPGSNMMYRVDYAGRGGGIGAIGNPSIRPPRTIQYELGIDANVAGLARVRLGGYYRDVTDQPGSVRYVNYPETVSYSTSENKNYQDIRGFELRIDRQFGQWISGWFNYDYIVTSSGDVGRSTYYQDPSLMAREGLEDPDQQITLPRPAANGYLAITTPNRLGFIVGGWTASVIWHRRAGSYFSYDPLDADLPSNNFRWPARHSVDARFQKNIDLGGGRRIGLFADVTNILNLKYIQGTFGGGDGEDETYYQESLHLPLYKDEAYEQFWYECDMETGIDYPVHPTGAAEWTEVVTRPGDDPLVPPDWWNGKIEEDHYHGADGWVEEYQYILHSVARDFDDQFGDKASDGKPYINMPNYYDFQAGDPVTVEFGLQISF